ncbi:hypothetical protein N9Q05_01485 [bacterium]|nr:hypothetical protein [bacterium]
MTLTPLRFQPGINREITPFANEGGWVDGDKIRFREAFPETIGGWSSFNSQPFVGTARSLHPWVTLTGKALLSLGTNLKYYIAEGGQPLDITPIRLTTSAGTTTFAATTGSTTIVVSHTLHGARLNAFITFSDAVSLGGDITADVLNAEHQIMRIVDTNTYEIVVGLPATASDTGDGGAATVAVYQINPGLDTVTVGTGWGTGPWSRGTWGSSSTTSVPTGQLRIWSQDNFGEDLIFCVRDGGIYYWDASLGTSGRGVNIVDLEGSQAAPTVARRVLVSERDRHTIAFGCDPEFDPGVQDPLVIRFSDQENVLEWRARETTTAGELRIGTGSCIVTAVQAKQQILVLTDISAHTMQFIGAPFTFGLSEVSTNISIAGPNAAVAAGDNVFWMGKGEFYAYAGQVQQMDCLVKDYVFSDINIVQLEKVVAGHNAAFSEIWWFYPSAASTENDRYVVYNYAQNVWYYGSMARTAWIDRGSYAYPLAASPLGELFYHEFGLNDGSENPPIAINAFIESSAVDIAEGDQFMFASRLLPDITFRKSTGTPLATFTLKAKNFPGGALFGDDATTTVRSATVPIEQFTTQTFVRIRGRAMALRVESNQTETSWRLGVPRLDIRTDGRR